MKKIVLMIVLILTTIATLLVYKNKTNTEKTEHFRIAIFQPAVHPAIDEISDGFKHTVQKKGISSYIFDHYNANGDKTLLRSQADEIIQQKYDLIVPIGADATRTVHELTTKKNITTPIVFSAVTDPVGLGVINSKTSSGNHVTGVEYETDFEEQLDTLLQIKPKIKQILLVYNPFIKAGSLEKNHLKIKEILDKKNITLKTAQIYQANEIQSRVQPMLTDTDVVLILIDNTVVSGIDILITLCNRYHITLFASDLNSGDKGAALSFGFSQYEIGAIAGRLALQILDNKEKPANIPIQKIEDNKLKINTKTMKQQGLSFTENDLKKIKNDGGIII